jgi:hypothetical protein
MANWSDLKAAIAQIIKTNNNQEITGANMQSVLNNIIDNVGENATYAGIATPSTNPGVPDGNVFYIASEAGTYSNFNNLVLDAGNIGIFVYKSSWKLDKIPVLSSNEIAQIVSVDYSENKWTGGEKYYIDASMGNRVDSDSHLTTERISLKARQKLQCGYFTSVNEDGTGKNWTDFKPNQFVNYWGKDGNFERKVSSGISFPFTAEEDCEVSFTWSYTEELSDFKMNKYHGMLIISDVTPTKYVKGGKAISPAIIIPQLDDYIKDDNISKTVEAGNNNPVSSGAVYDTLKTFSENLIQSEGKIPNLYAGARFFNERQKVETNISGNVYYLSDTGNDSNSGLSKDDAFLTANKALSVLADGDTLLIERGCHFRDVTQRITNKNYIKISAYGVGDNPVFEYLSILTNWEKVSEYNYIYRCNVHVTKCVANRGMTQVFVDGKYMNVVYDTNDMEEAEAMEYLDEHPDSSSWCSCGKYSEGWEEQDCYYYVSLSDAPKNHEIEANLNFTSGFIGIGNKHFDIRHLCQRGSGYRDGYSAAYNTYFEDCQFLDIAHHGIVFSKACFLNCTIKSEDPRGYQYHFLTDDKLSEDEDLICVNCKAIMGGVYGSAFSGHRGGGIEIKYSNLYIEDCYVEGGSSVIGDTEYVNHLQVHNLILKNAGCIKGSSNNPGKVTINSIFGSIKQKPSGNNSILVSGNGAENIEIINARIEIYCPYNDAQQAICLFRNNGNINGNFTNVIIKNSIFKWNFSDNMEPNGYNAIFHSALNDMDTGDFNLENVMFVANKTIPLGRPDTVHLTNSIFSNVILAGVDKSDVEKNCEEITLDEYNIMSLEKLFVNGGVICAI